MPVRDPLACGPPAAVVNANIPLTFWQQLRRFHAALKERVEGAHGPVTLVIDAALGQENGVVWTSGDTASYWLASTLGGVAIPITLPVGERLLSVQMHGRDGAANTWTLSVWKHALGTATWTQLGTTQTSGITSLDSSLTVPLGEEIVTGFRYYARFTAAVANNQRCYALTVIYDHP